MNTAPASVRNPSAVSDWTDKEMDHDSNTARSASIIESPPVEREEGGDDKYSNNGWICGGKFLEELKQDENKQQLDGSLKEVDIDIPLTRTIVRTDEGKDLIELKFAPDDRENPFKWSPWRRRFISTQLNLMTLFIGLATTAYSSGIGSMVTDLNCGNEMGQLGLFTFNMACAVAPLFLAPFCELVGRKVIYAGAYLGFSLCFIGLALGKNIQTIIVMRLLLGLFGCVGTILVGGTFSDMYEPHERAKPMAAFAYVAILGTVGAPIYAG